MLFNMIQYVAHVSVSKTLSDVLLPQNVTILEISISRLVRRRAQHFQSRTHQYQRNRVFLS